MTHFCAGQPHRYAPGLPSVHVVDSAHSRPAPRIDLHRMSNDAAEVPKIASPLPYTTMKSAAVIAGAPVSVAKRMPPPAPLPSTS